MDLIDSHAHVDVSDFDADREAMLDRARAAGVGTLLAIGNGPEIEKLGAAVPYAEAHDWIYAAAGIHPHEAQACDRTRIMPNWTGWRGIPRVIAWGEIGLDYHYDHSPRDVQARVFSPAARSGARRQAADHHPLPGSLAGLPENPRRGLAEFRLWAGFSIVLQERSRKRASAWTWDFSSRSRGT